MYINYDNFIGPHFDKLSRCFMWFLDLEIQTELLLDREWTTRFDQDELVDKYKEIICRSYQLV